MSEEAMNTNPYEEDTAEHVIYEQLMACLEYQQGEIKVIADSVAFQENRRVKLASLEKRIASYRAALDKLSA